MAIKIHSGDLLTVTKMMKPDKGRTRCG